MSLAEIPIIPVQLSPMLSNPNAELSGLDWYADYLIILPQYPEQYADTPEDQGALFAISKQNLIDYLDGKAAKPLDLTRIPIFGPNLAQLFPGYEGFEAIAFSGDTVFFLIENTQNGTQAHLVSAYIEPDLAGIYLQSGSAAVPLNADIPNLSAETLVVFGRRVLAIPEVNGYELAPEAAAPLFSFDLTLQNSLRFANLPYRVTDASQVDENGIFWVINYFYPGEPELDGIDFLRSVYPPGPTHKNEIHVERLVAYQFRESGLEVANQPVIWLELLPDDTSRNWEGLAILPGRGFLLVTDRYPGTLFGLVPFPVDK